MVNTKKNTCSVIYRPPSASVPELLDIYEQFLDEIDENGDNFVFMEDFNLDILSYDNINYELRN